MKTVFDFLRTTLLGGLLVLLPIYLIVLLMLKAASQLHALLAPLVAVVPAGQDMRDLIAGGIVLAACFCAGLIVRTGLGRRAFDTFQRRLLAKIPGYTVLRNLTARVSGDDSTSAFSPALVELEDALVPAFIVEEMADGRCVVMVPSVPTPVAGALYVLPAARVHRVDVPMRTLLTMYSKWGEGTAALVAAMEARRSIARP